MKKRKAQTPDRKASAADLLAKALKQPGVKTAMEAYESAEKYTQSAVGYTNVVQWYRLPTVSSCDTTCPV